ncbi:MAG TPA: IS1182 family transposase [Gallicola sp.]|nr:IS1182 family transposase [Gallicola sp.]
MITKNENKSLNTMQVVSIDDLVPKDHLVRKLAKTIDFEFIRDKVKYLYSDCTGRPSIDPVVLFKIVFIQFLFGIKSMRKTISEIEVNAAYRWYLGFDFSDPIPHYSTFSQNYRRRFADSNIFSEIFEEILKQVIKKGLLSEDTIFVDSTHIKAYANKRKADEKYVKEDTNRYVKALQDELNKIRTEEGKKEINFNTVKKVAVSRTDPESGMFHKGEKEKQFAYSVQTACDKNGWIVGCKTYPGNVNDNNAGVDFIIPYLEKHPKVDYTLMDAGYTGSLIINEILNRGRVPIVPYVRPKGLRSNGLFKKNFKFDQEKNEYTCPYGKKLTYKGVNTQGYLQYKSSKKDCDGCPFKSNCTKSSTKTLTRHLLENTKNITRDIRLSEVGREKYELRKKTIERVFADCKMNHCLGFTLVRGLKKNENRNLIIFAMANYKKMANLLHRNGMNISNYFFKTIISKLKSYKVTIKNLINQKKGAKILFLTPFCQHSETTHSGWFAFLLY